jgi:hypothetical protein
VTRARLGDYWETSEKRLGLPGTKFEYRLSNVNDWTDLLTLGNAVIALVAVKKYPDCTGNFPLKSALLLYLHPVLRTRLGVENGLLCATCDLG